MGQAFKDRNDGEDATPSDIVEQVPVDGSKRTGHVLVADDYATNQQVARLHLTSAGIRVDLVENGKQAVDAYRENHYDLILMDIQMPELNGLDATGAIRALEAELGKPRTPIIALTANAMKGDEQRCLDAGMDGYLTKPVRRDQLLDSVDHWIGRRGDAGSEHPLQAQPSVPSTAEPDTIMDTETVVDEFGDAETVKIVAQKLIANVEGQLKAVRQSIDKLDRDGVRREAHAIKGGAATMEAIALSRTAAHLEQISRKGTIEALAVGCRELENQYARFRNFIAHWEEA